MSYLRVALTTNPNIYFYSSYSDAVLHSTDDSETIVTGKVTISATPLFTNLTLGTGKKLHNVYIGNCAAPKILLKSGSCVPDNTQTVTGSITFNTDKKKKPLTLTKTVLAAADSKVNGENFANILSSMVSKTKQVEETFTKKKTFKQAHFDVDPNYRNYQRCVRSVCRP